MLQEMQQREQVNEQLAEKAAAAEAAVRQQALNADTGNLLDPAVIAQEQAAEQAAALPVKRRPPDGARALRLGAVSAIRTRMCPYMLL